MIFFSSLLNLVVNYFVVSATSYWPANLLTRLLNLHIPSWLLDENYLGDLSIGFSAQEKKGSDVCILKIPADVSSLYWCDHLPLWDEHYKWHVINVPDS